MARNTKELRDKAVAEVQAGRPLLELAQELGVSTNTLRAWLRNAAAKAKAHVTARRVAATLSREKRPESSQRMRLLIHALEQSPATIIISDAEGRIVYANPKFTETTGYAVDEVLGKNPRFLRSGHTPPAEYRQLWKTILAGKEWRGEFHNRRKDGSLYWERASISPVFDAEGRIANFMAVKENITEFKKADFARQKAEENFRAVLGAMAEGILLFDESGRIELANAAAGNLLGRAPEQLAGKRLEELGLRWLNERRESVPAAALPDQRVIQEGNPVDADFSVVLQDGREIWLQVRARPVAPRSSAAAAVLSLSDVSERKARDHRLALAALLFNHGPQPALVIDAGARIAALNDAFEALTGYARAEMLGRPLHSFAPAGRSFCPEAWPALSAVGRWEGETRLRRKGGRAIYAQISITAVHNSSSTADCYLIALTPE